MSKPAKPTYGRKRRRTPPLPAVAAPTPPPASDPAVLKRLVDLEARIAKLEKEAVDQLPFPFLPQRPAKPSPFDEKPAWPTIPMPSPWKRPMTPWADQGTTCSRCGVEWKGVMGYCCPHISCPMGAGSTLCRTTTTATREEVYGVTVGCDTHQVNL